jgi:hypothetical protein
MEDTQAATGAPHQMQLAASAPYLDGNSVLIPNGMSGLRPRNKPS